MKKKGYILIGMLIIFIAGYLGFVSARSVGSVSSFYRVLEKEKLAVAMLYRSDKNMKKENRPLYKKIEEAKSAFKTLSSVRLYKNADIRFIRANIAEKKLSSLPGDFSISVHQEPVYILFKNGRPIKGPNMKGITHGFFNVGQLRSFIDSNMSDAIEDYLDDKAERRARERARADTRVYFGVGGGYPWYGAYPYYGGWGYPYGGYGGGRVGFGISFGI